MVVRLEHGFENPRVIVTDSCESSVLVAFQYFKWD